jgi:AmmeMemoRadiSam system protein A
MNFVLTDEDKAWLLALARRTIAERLGLAAGDAALSAQPQSPGLVAACGAFVTLNKKRHAPGDNGLRGCIGLMASDNPLRETVKRMALAAAFEDPRFPPLSQGELGDCRIEISALSPMEPCPDPHSVVVGRDGILLQRWGRQGVFLPQVPVEEHWSQEQYLESICYKAGLPAGSWEAPDAQRWTFQAVVFGED